MTIRTNIWSKTKPWSARLEFGIKVLLLVDLLLYIFLTYEIREQILTFLYPGEVRDSAMTLGLAEWGPQPPSLFGPFGRLFIAGCAGALLLRRARPICLGPVRYIFYGLAFLYCRLIQQDFADYDWNRTTFALVLLILVCYPTSDRDRTTNSGTVRTDLSAN